MRAALCLLASAMLPIACATAPKSKGPDRTHGLSLHLRGEDQRAVYEVDTEGNVIFRGGRDAILDHTTWAGTLTAIQCETWVDLVQWTEWLSAPPKSSSGEEPAFDIDVADASTARSFTVPKDDERATVMYDFLQKVASQRFDNNPETNPVPSIETLIKRRGR